MEKIYTNKLIAFLILTILMGCTGLEVSRVKRLIFKPEILKLKPNNLRPSLNQALLVARAYQNGDLSSLPFINIDGSSNIDVDKILIVAVKKVLNITNYCITPKGNKRLDLTAKYMDRYGRIDFRLINMVYKTEEPNKTQREKIKAWLLKQYSSSKRNHNNTLKNNWKTFQKETGLHADGQFGPVTATALSHKFSMIHVRTIKNKIIYPEKPNHMLFILPYKVFMGKKNTLPKGFRSWIKVSKSGLSKDEFKKTMKKGNRYTLFIYFFDRVNPAFGIDIHFANTINTTGNSRKTDKYYAKTGTWPVIVRSFTINKIPDKLYINIFIQKSSFNKTCVGSHKLL